MIYLVFRDLHAYYDFGEGIVSMYLGAFSTYEKALEFVKNYDPISDFGPGKLIELDANDPDAFDEDGPFETGCERYFIHDNNEYALRIQPTEVE